MTLLTRREWLLRCGALASYSAWPAIPGCGDNLPAFCVNEPALPGPGELVGIFEVTPTEVTIWVASPTPVLAQLDVGPPSSCEPASYFVQLVPVTSSCAIGSTVVVDLVPATAYECVVRFGEGDSSRVVTVFRFDTAPGPATVALTRFVVSADIAPDFSYDVFDVMAAHTPDFYLNLGDWPYVDHAPAAVTTEEFHEKHRVARSEPAVQRFLTQVPVFATYDDHDVTDNWDGADDPALVATGVEVWRSWFPQRGAVQYRSWRWGALVEFFALDTRLYRSPNAMPDGPDKTMLGADQKAWFKEALRSSTAPFKCVLTSVPLDYGNSSDDWTAFLTERDELLSFIREEAIDGMVFLTADRHWFAAHHLPGGIREYQFGPLAAGLGNPPDVFPPEVVAFHLTRNYGLITVEEGEGGPQMTIECRDASGAVLYQEKLRNA